MPYAWASMPPSKRLRRSVDGLVHCDDYQLCKTESIHLPGIAPRRFSVGIRGPITPRRASWRAWFLEVKFGEQVDCTAGPFQRLDRRTTPVVPARFEEQAVRAV